MAAVTLPVSPAVAYLLVTGWSAVPFLPAEPMLVAAGSWAATGGLTLGFVIVAAAVGSFVSDIAKYALGRVAGPAMLRRLRRHPSGERAVDWIDFRMGRAGAAVIVPSYFVPLGVVVATLLSGVLRLPLRAVMIASLVGALVWASVFTSLGYVGGALTGNPFVGLLLGLPAAVALGWLVNRRTTARAA